MRGSTPLDVAAASVMDNNELALALEEPDLDKVSDHSYLFTYLLNSALVLEGKRARLMIVIFGYDLLEVLALGLCCLKVRLTEQCFP